MNCLVYGLFLQYNQSHKIDGIWGGYDERRRKQILQEYEATYGRYRDRKTGGKSSRTRGLLPHHAPKHFFDEIISIINLCSDLDHAKKAEIHSAVVKIQGYADKTKKRREKATMGISNPKDNVAKIGAKATIKRASNPQNIDVNSANNTTINTTNNNNRGKRSANKNNEE